LFGGRFSYKWQDEVNDDRRRYTQMVSTTERLVKAHLNTNTDVIVGPAPFYAESDTPAFI